MATKAFEITSEQAIEKPVDIAATDLRDEANDASASGVRWQAVSFAVTGCPDGVTALYFPEHGRAGVSAGGDSKWTDAESCLDAVERFFGIDGKVMAN
jgi:hypothetical protein